MSSALRWWAVTLAAILLAMCGELLAQDRTSAPELLVDAADPFSAYHDALDRTAENVLVRSDERQVATSSVPNVVALLEPPLLADRQMVDPAMLRVQQLRFLIDPILRHEGVPTELVAVVLVESGGQPLALSPKGARGIWQLMPDTARRYGLAVGADRDERLDAANSTRAAARYLRDLYVQFGSWQLALAAYNSGERLVQQALDSAGSSDFSAIRRRLPVETQNYVPAVLSATVAFQSSSTGAANTDRRGEPPRIIYAPLGVGE